MSKGDPLKNYLLSALPEKELQGIQGRLTQVSFQLGDVIYSQDDRIDVVYFPTTAIVSLVYDTQDGASTEIGLIGNDGVVGVALLTGAESASHRAIVQSAGDAYKMTASEMRVEFARNEIFHDLMMRYIGALMAQIAQTAVCNRVHSIEQQLCRWLLLTHDRLHSNELTMTHDMISTLLGVRREGVTLAAQKLAAKQLILNRRGTITVIDRRGMEAAVCECYAVVNAQYNKLLGRGMARTFS